MATSYWQSENVVKMAESDVEIPAENQLNFSAGQKISLYIPPSVRFLDGAQSYLKFKVKIQLPSDLDHTNGKYPTKLQLDPMGASVLFENMRIYDGNRQTLLEEYVDYHELVCLKKDYDTDESQKKLSVREGGTTYSIPNRGTNGTLQSDVADTKTNPYFKAGSGINASLTNADFTEAVVCVPIHSGIFSGDQLFPIFLTNGLYIEWDLNPSARVIKQLDSVLADRRSALNPVFDSLDGAGTNWVNGSALGPDSKFYVRAQNNMSGSTMLDSFPFVLDEKFGFVSKALDTGGELEFVNGSAALHISEINACATNGLIEVVVRNGSDIVNNASGGIDVSGGNFVMYSRSVCAESSYNATYEISDFNLVCHEVQLDPSYESGMLSRVREGKAIEFDIHSVTTYKNSLLASDRQATFYIHAQNTRAKSVLVHTTDATPYTSAQLISASGTYIVTEALADSTDYGDTILRSNRSGYVGIQDFLSSIQFQMNGKLVPSRPVLVKKCATKRSIDAFFMFELEKGLANAGITPRSFEKYLENFTISRGLALGKGVSSLVGKDLAVILKYEESEAPEKNKMVNTFVPHIRRLVLRGSGNVSVEV